MKISLFLKKLMIAVLMLASIATTMNAMYGERAGRRGGYDYADPLYGMGYLPSYMQNDNQAAISYYEKRRAELFKELATPQINGDEKTRILRQIEDCMKVILQLREAYAPREAAEAEAADIPARRAEQAARRAAAIESYRRMLQNEIQAFTEQIAAAAAGVIVPAAAVAAPVADGGEAGEPVLQAAAGVPGVQLQHNQGIVAQLRTELGRRRAELASLNANDPGTIARAIAHAEKLQQEEMTRLQSFLNTHVSLKGRNPVDGKTVRDLIEEDIRTIDKTIGSLAGSNRNFFTQAFANAFISPNYRIPPTATVTDVIYMGLLNQMLQPASENIKIISSDIFAELRSRLSKVFASMMRYFGIGHSFIIKDFERWNQAILGMVSSLEIASAKSAGATAGHAGMDFNAYKHAVQSGDVEKVEEPQAFLLRDNALRMVDNILRELKEKKKFYLPAEERRKSLSSDSQNMVSYIEQAEHCLHSLQQLLLDSNTMAELADPSRFAQIKGIAELFNRALEALRFAVDPNAHAKVEKAGRYGGGYAQGGYGGTYDAYGQGYGY